MERLSNNEEIRLWRDHIPLEWKYTAGVAGERFLQSLKQGKIQGGLCRSCNKTLLPPKIYCKDCFVQVTEWRDIPAESGYLYSFTKVKNPEGQSGRGEDDAEGQIIALVKFEGIEGGLLGRFKSGKEDPRVGMKVKAVFKPKDDRKGELSDIEYFEKI